MKVIPLKFCAMFKQAFSHPDIFNRFVEDILGISFHADKIHTEYEYPEPIGFVRSTYDLFATDEKQRIIVEIQHIKEDDFFDRFLYYHLISLVEQAGGYDEYRFNQTVYTIVVLTSTPRDGSVNFSCAVSDMNPIDEYGKVVELYPHRLVFLCPRQVNKQTPKKIRKWLQFIEDSLDGEMDETRYSYEIWQQLMALIKRVRLLYDVIWLHTEPQIGLFSPKTLAIYSLFVLTHVSLIQFLLLVFSISYPSHINVV
jgi:hypothetical protein